jgi:hypothetical protein
MKRTTKIAGTSEGFTLGRQSFAKISAVEGIKLSPEMAADFQEFDRQQLTASARRKAIRHKYGKATV